MQTVRELEGKQSKVAIVKNKISIMINKCTCMMSKQTIRIKHRRWLGGKHCHAVHPWKVNSTSRQHSFKNVQRRNVPEQITSPCDAETD